MARQPERSKRYLTAMGLLWLLFGAGQVFQFVGRRSDHPLVGDALSYMAVSLFFLAIWLAVTYFRRARSTYQSAQNPSEHA